MDLFAGVAYETEKPLAQDPLLGVGVGGLPRLGPGLLRGGGGGFGAAGGRSEEHTSELQSH